MSIYNEDMIKMKGKVIFDPLPLMGSTKMFKPFWAILITTCDVSKYYTQIFERSHGKRVWTSITDENTKIMDIDHNIKLQRPAWGNHVSFIRGEAFETKYDTYMKGVSEYFKSHKLNKDNIQDIYLYLFANNYITQKDYEKWMVFKEKYDKKIIEFEHELTPKTVKNKSAHWWLRVKSEKLKDIREEMGYNRNPYWGLHMTLGIPTPNSDNYSLKLSKDEKYGR